MSNRDVDVCVDAADGTPIRVGRLFLTRRRGSSESATFHYSDEWLARVGAYAIDPPVFYGCVEYRCTKNVEYWS